MRVALRTALSLPVATAVVVWVAAVSAGCRPKAAPTGPGVEPENPAATKAPPKPTPRAHPAYEVLIGEMCPDRAAGRAAVMPIFVRRMGWSAAADDVAQPLERHAARQFSVHHWDGSRAGVFSVAGVAEVGLDRRVAVGAYAGSSPCMVRSDKKPNPACVAAQGHCGVAVAILEPGGGYRARPFDEDPDPFALPIAGACVAEGKLLIDIDDDGSVEAYPVARFLNPVRAPAEEVLAVARSTSTCSPQFASRNIIPPGDPKHWRGLDLLGVIDIDGDGRYELIVAYHYSDRRTWAIYSATSMVGRLDLVSESIPWPRP